MPFPAPPGTPVAINGILPSATVNAIATNITKTINAVDGDTLTPTNPIVVSSGVVQFANTSTLDVESLLTLTAPGVANLSGSVNVYGNTTFDATTVSISGTTAVSFGGSTTTTCINGWIGTFQAGTVQNLSGAWNLKNGATATHESGSATTFATGSTVSLGTSVNLATNTRTYTRPCRPIAMFDVAYWLPPWMNAPIVTTYKNLIVGSSSTDRLVFDIDVPDGATITGFSIWIDPANTHGALPIATDQPMMELLSFDRATSTRAVESSVQDNQTLLVDYEARHQITKTGASVLVDAANKSYTLVVYPEKGVNATIDGVYEIPDVTFTRGKVGEER